MRGGLAQHIASVLRQFKAFGNGNAAATLQLVERLRDVAIAGAQPLIERAGVDPYALDDVVTLSLQHRDDASVQMLRCCAKILADGGLSDATRDWLLDCLAKIDAAPDQRLAEAGRRARKTGGKKAAETRKRAAHQDRAAVVDEYKKLISAGWLPRDCASRIATNLGIHASTVRRYLSDTRKRAGT